VLIDGSVATVALADPVLEATEPAWNATSRPGLIAVDGYPTMRIAFGGTDTANQTINYQVVLWHRVQNGTGTAWVGRIAAKGQAILGALTYGAGTGIGATGNLLADIISDQIGQAGTTIYTDVGRAAVLEINTSNAVYAEVELDLANASPALGDAVTADVLVQFGERHTEVAVPPVTVVAIDAVVADATNSTLATLIGDYKRTKVSFTVTNTHATTVFDAFLIETQAHPDAPWMTLASGTDIDPDETSAIISVVVSAHTIATLEKDESASVTAYVGPVYAVRMAASGNAAAGTASIWASLA